MEIRLGCEPHVIYRPYLSQVRDDTASIIVDIDHDQRPDDFFWYCGQRFAYLHPNPWYTGPVTYRKVADGVP